MRRNIRNYEKPEGWSKGQPEVLVAKNVVKKLGMPVVNYDSLHQFVTDDIGVPYYDKTFIKLYGQSKYSMVGGFHYPYTRTVHVNAITSENMYPYYGGTMRILAHELRHRADSTNRKAVTAVEVAARYASYKAGLEVATFVPLLSSAPIIGAIATRQTWYAVEPPEKRARKQENELETSPHQADILFPDTMRATLMILAGFVPKETASELCLSELYDSVQGQDISVTFVAGDNQRVFRSQSTQPFDQQ